MHNSLTILFQGPVIAEENMTFRSIQSARKHFPDTQIILSTWEEHKELIDNKFLAIKNLKFIYSIDPGAPFCKPNSPLNVNRVIVSSRNGLKNIKTDYVFKCRSDIFFQNAKAIDLYHKFKSIDSPSSDALVSEKLLFSNQTSLNPNRVPILYHLCDWLVLGRTEDVIKIFDTELMPAKDFHWFLYNKKPEDSLTPGNLSRYMSEDYIIFKFCQKYISNIKHNHYFDYDEEMKIKWLDIIALNFIILPNKMLGLHSLKYHNVSDFHLYKSWTFHEWHKLSSSEISIYAEFFDKSKILFYTLLSKIYEVLINIKRKYNK